MQEITYLSVCIRLYFLSQLWYVPCLCILICIFHWFVKLIRIYLIYPTRFCLASLRPYDNGSVNLVTIPSGPKTFGILSNESDRERDSECSCTL